MIDKTLLLKGSSSLGVALSDETVALLDAFSDFVAEENKKFNLTAITSPAEFTEKHIIDSLASLPFIPQGSSLCDVGAGAGFPSFPIAAARGDVTVTALDSTSKKTDFIKRAAQKFGLNNIRTLSKRAEECTHERESFDVVTARAVAPISILSELCLPLVKKGGLFIAYKTDPFDLPSEECLSFLGGKLRLSHPYTLPSGDGRVLLVFEKISHTHPDFPRPYGKIKRSPL